MIVKTSRFGDKEVPDEALLTFPEGVIGFRDATRFVMFECSDDGIFKWLQSCDRPELAFVICEANVLVQNYQILIGEKERQVLRLAKPEDAVVCLILVIPEDPMDSTANLLGPLVMNTETRLGMQIVVVNPQYSTRHKLFREALPGEQGLQEKREQMAKESEQQGGQDASRSGGREEAANAGA